jgi:3-isopropylmalate dehydrogenase
MDYQIALLGGDGIGPEVTGEAKKVLEAVGNACGHSFSFQEAIIGGGAIDAVGDPLPEETIEVCRASDAVLFGAVGGPKWDDPSADVRPEQGLLGLRKELGLFANLRPVKLSPALTEVSTIKADVLQGTDLLVVRELTGGIYFGERGRRDDGTTAYDTMIYSEHEIDRVVRVAFDLARKRRKRVISVDKANVLEVSRLWRETATQVAEDYPDVTFENLLVDACTMHLIRRPASFDVLVTGNMFGDILTDEASMLAGSMGMLPSASLAQGDFGLFEPIHGTAPDIAGKGIANPIGAVYSAAMLLRYALDLDEEAEVIENAVDDVLAKGYRTADIAEEGAEVVGTQVMGDLIADSIEV